MSTKQNETATYNRYRKNLQSKFRRIDRIENPIVPGMPDVSNCWRGTGDFWVEIKSPTEPVRATSKLFAQNHKVKQNQINWIEHHIQCGGKAWLLIDTNKRLILVSGVHVAKLNDMTVDEICEIADFVEMKPMKAEKWKTLALCLMV